MRCRKTGAQLSTGDVLNELKVFPKSYLNAYEVLRRVSDGVGVDYVDGAGRRHKLYTWRDLPVLAQRIQDESSKLRERRYRTEKGIENEAKYEPNDYLDIPF